MGNADTIVSHDEMGGEFAEAKQQAHSGCMRMAMDVGQAFLGKPVNRGSTGLRKPSGISRMSKDGFEPCAAAKAFDQQFQGVRKPELLQRRRMGQIGD